MSRRGSLGLAAVLPLYMAVATAAGFVDYHIRPSPAHGYQEYVPSVLHGTAEAPGRYRVLGPAAFGGLVRLSGLADDDAWILFRWLCLLAALCAGHVWYRSWFSAGGAVAGNALTAALLPLTFTNSWAHPDHLLELALCSLGYACIARRRYGSFLIVLSAAALNRETSFLLVLVLVGAAPWGRTHFRWVALAGLVWTAVYAGLRWRLGFVAYDPRHFTENLHLLFWWPAERDLYYRLYSWFFVVLIGGPLLVAARRWRALPGVLRFGLGVALPLFLAVGLLFSSIIEPRIFTPLIPLLTAGVLFTFFEPEGTAARPAVD